MCRDRELIPLPQDWFRGRTYFHVGLDVIIAPTDENNQLIAVCAHPVPCREVLLTHIFRVGSETGWIS